jgi:hypothetical protein
MQLTEDLHTWDNYWWHNKGGWTSVLFHSELCHYCCHYFALNLANYWLCGDLQFSPYRNKNQSGFPSPARMKCAVVISVTFCSSMANRRLGNNWRFWTNPFVIVPIAPIIYGTIFILTFHILLTLISRSLYLLCFSVYFPLMFGSCGTAISTSGQVLRFVSPCIIVQFK